MDHSEQQQVGESTPSGIEHLDIPQKNIKGSEETPPPPSPNALKVAATECLSSWIYYLQMLNSLCSAGVRLSHSLYNLAQSQNAPLATQCQASWEDLAKTTSFASHTVKAHIAAAMQDMVIGETFTEYDSQRQQEHNQQIITENLLTFVNLQYQFSIASCECLGPMAMCPSCQTTPGGQHDPECSMAALQQCFAQLYSHEARSRMSSPHSAAERGALDSPKTQEVKSHSEHPRQPSPINPSSEPRGSSPYHEPYRGPSPIHGFAGHGEIIRGPFPNPGQLHTMKSPFPMRSSRSPLNFPLFPLVGQRRWSEAAAGEVSGESSDSTMRRWSMPWDCGRVEAAPWQQRYFPTKLAVPTAGVSQDRSRSATPESGPSQPGTITSGEGLAEAIQLLSCRPMRCAIPHGPLSAQFMQTYGATPLWTEGHEERMPRRMYSGPLQRGIWQSVDAPHSSGMSVTEHYDIFPAGLPLTSRKSSSSTDSSSCLSIHSRSTTSSSERGSDGPNCGGDAARLHTNLYSIWSGSDHLPFIRLPESQEPQDDSDTENTPTDQVGQPLFPKPS